jgi:hypothetical protein
VKVAGKTHRAIKMTAQVGGRTAYVYSIVGRVENSLYYISVFSLNSTTANNIIGSFYVVK